MSIQNNPAGNIFTLGGKVKQTAKSGDNSAIAKNATQTTAFGINSAVTSQDIKTAFFNNIKYGPDGPEQDLDTILALGQKNSLAKQQGTSNSAVGYQHINQVYSPPAGIDAATLKQNGLAELLEGHNFAYGTNFNDHIVQNGIDNLTYSGKGNDVISVKGASNTVNAGDGNDRITVKQAAQVDGKPNITKIDGGNGSDFVTLYGKASDWQGGPDSPDFGISFINKKTGDQVFLKNMEGASFEKSPNVGTAF